VFSYVDLFAGCGGLSLGLRRGGGTELFAVEKSEGAGRTFFANLIADQTDVDTTYKQHLGLSVTQQAAAGLVVAPVSDVLDVFDELEMPNEIGLVAGGPPCQGFSLAGRRNKNDVRNQLVWEFLRFVAKTNPRFVIIENVIGMGRKFSVDDEGSTFADVEKALAQTGRTYVVNGLLLNAQHYGAPQQRPRLMIIAIRRDVADALGIKSSGQLWKSTFLTSETNVPDFAPRPIPAKKRVLLGSAIRDLENPPAKNDTPEYVLSLKDNVAWRLASRNNKPLNHEMRNHRAPTIYRFRFAQALVSLGGSARAMGPVSADFLEKEMLKIDKWFSAEPDRQVKVGADIFTTAVQFKEKLLLLQNKKHSQRVLRWTEPAYTVVTIPDDYIHPVQPRTFSVRELARMQGFPDDFVFEGKTTTGGTDRRTSVPQYTQVGNAVSPLVGLALGLTISKLNSRYEATLDLSGSDASPTPTGNLAQLVARARPQAVKRGAMPA
jgi:DNA (cytosine-5)-methyltransferase 1